ncbi:MAG: polysaccharide deacetylase family protein [Massilia sp.]
MSSDHTELRAGCLFTETPEDEIIKAVSVIRTGDILKPTSWPGGARVAVAITFDVDHEFPVYKLDPSLQSLGEYGATTAMPRILALLKRHGVPGTFFVPGMTQRLHPETVPDILAGGHEVGLHGWVHERAPDLRDREEEELMITKTIKALTDAGAKPIGYRAPNSALSEHTLGLLDKHGIEYDSSLCGRDEAYEVLVHGKKVNVVEIPMSWENDDFIFLHNDEFWQGTFPSPKGVLEAWQSDFDVAYSEGTLFNLVMHPHVIGRRSRSAILDQLLSYMRSKDSVWFATLGQIARHVKQHAVRAT